MKMVMFSICIVLVTCTGCATERLRISVTDSFDKPISNATVHVSFTSGHVVFGRGTPRHFRENTGKDGKAIVCFNCDSADVHWFVKADGYYPSDFYKEVFQIEVIPIPPIFYKVNMLENEKVGK